MDIKIHILLRSSSTNMLKVCRQSANATISPWLLCFFVFKYLPILVPQSDALLNPNHSVYQRQCLLPGM